MVQKSNKPKHQISSYCPISLLPIIDKLFERILYKHITPIIQEKNVLPKTQFGFRTKHNTIHQIHRITYKISTSFEEKNSVLVSSSTLAKYLIKFGTMVYYLNSKVSSLRHII
jgi:hypothetical protein